MTVRHHPGHRVGIFILAHVKRGGVAAGAEIELAPNRKPYFDDEELEGPKLERALVVALDPARHHRHRPPAVLAGRAQPPATRQGFDDRAVGAGFLLFQPTDTPLTPHPQANALPFGCATCHGNKGQGGVTNYVVTEPPAHAEPGHLAGAAAQHRAAALHP